MGHEFDRAKTGIIAGRVSWTGAPPVADPFKVYGVAGTGVPRHERPNPRLPKIDAESGGVGQAVVFLRQVDASQARPWDHGPIRIELVQREISIFQGDAPGKLGIARLGDTVEITNRDADLHILRARGAAFFSLPFPESQRPTQRRLDKSGVVELSSGAGFFWMTAHIFVGDHPYFAITDARGNYKLDEVPAGSYQVVCWLPNWQVVRFNRHTEATIVNAVEYRPAVEQERSVGVAAGNTTEIHFNWALKNFN